jgi:hypothetical protein
MFRPLNYVFRLQGWSIKHQDGFWYISNEDHPKKWGRKYKSLQSASAAVARKLCEEWMARAHRLQRAPKARRAA